MIKRVFMMFQYRMSYFIPSKDTKISLITYQHQPLPALPKVQCRIEFVMNQQLKMK